jgi:hypothetical protein
MGPAAEKKIIGGVRMKKLLIAVFAVAVALAAGQAYALPGVYNAGANTMSLLVGSCETRTVSLDGTGFGTSPLVSGGVYIDIPNDTIVTFGNVQCYDSELTPAVWDPGSVKIPDPSPNVEDYAVVTSNLGAGVAPSASILICTVEFCGVASGTVSATLDTIPGAATWVAQNFTNYDATVDADTIDITVTANPCECSIAGLAVINASAIVVVTEPYTASGDAECTNPEDYDYTIACVGSGATIDINTGLVTVPIADPGGTCTITATDTANSDVNTNELVECTLDITIIPGALCATEIALGRFCPEGVVDDPAYNRPGRRGIAATCGDIIDFTVCNNSTVPWDATDCLDWTITPSDLGTITQIDECCWRLVVGDICDELDKVIEATITVSDSCCLSTDSVSIDIGKVIIDLGETTAQPNSESSLVDIDMVNLDHSVRALTMDVAGCTGPDNLVCTSCVADPDRALAFTCSANEQPNGSCRIVLYSTNPAAVITQGRGTIAQIVYEAGPELEDLCGDDACIDLCAINVKASDQFNEDLCTCTESGEVCFVTCGDIFPQDCIGGTCGAQTCCGDGVIDLFDILEGVDIILGLQTATACQIGNGDVPNGMPPYCGNPAGTPNCEGDGDIDIFDVLVMIDKALGKMNCCDYCIYGNIF